MSELINRDRRTFLANGVVGVAAAQLGASSLALANPAEAKLPLKQIAPAVSTAVVDWLKKKLLVP